MHQELEVLNRVEFKTDQSWNRETIIRVDNHRLMVTIKHDAYQSQSYARIKRWSSSAWQDVAHIPSSHMSSWQAKPAFPGAPAPVSYTSKEAPTKPFQYDEDELIRLALLVLY